MGSRATCAALALALSACSGGGGEIGGSDDGGGSVDAAFPSAPHPPLPAMPANDGDTLAPLRLVTIVAGSDPLADSLFAFGDALAASQWWKAVGADYGLGPVGSTARLVGPAITSDMGDHAFFTYIHDLLDAQGGPLPDGNTLYLLYLPVGVNILRDGGVNTNCHLLGGYHTPYGTRGDGFAIVQRCPVSAPETQLDNLTIIASHEIIEAATDPTGRGYNLGTAPVLHPWTENIWLSYEASGHDEVGDLCEGTRVREGRFVYQRSWSLAGAAAGGDPCAPALANAYFDVSAPDGWYPVAAGGSVDVPLTGWSTGPVADWLLLPHLKHASSTTATFGMQLTGPRMQGSGTNARVLMNNGGTATLTITAPAGTPSGTSAVITVHSYTGTAGFDSDQYHYWLIGTYVQ
jgi:hypothetical protein